MEIATEGHGPAFIIIGAAKSGTSTIFRHLRDHPGVYAERKEPRFFDVNFEKGWAWYAAHFAGAADGQICGEASVSYTMYKNEPVVPLRMSQHLPNVKLIYITRHPLERIISNWTMLVREKNQDMAPLWETPFEDGIFDPRWKHLLVDRSKYWKHISAFREHYDDSQIKCMFYEDFVANPQIFMDELHTFLGLEPRIINADSSFRSANKLTLYEADRPTWGPKLLKRVREEIEPDMVQFLSFARKPKSYWKLDRNSVEMLHLRTEVTKLRGMLAQAQKENAQLRNSVKKQNRADNNGDGIQSERVEHKTQTEEQVGPFQNLGRKLDLYSGERLPVPLRRVMRRLLHIREH